MTLLCLSSINAACAFLMLDSGLRRSCYEESVYAGSLPIGVTAHTPDPLKIQGCNFYN